MLVMDHVPAPQDEFSSHWTVLWCLVGMGWLFDKEDDFQSMADLSGMLLASRGRRYERPTSVL